jgi:hypothetical protein
MKWSARNRRCFIHHVGISDPALWTIAPLTLSLVLLGIANKGVFGTPMNMCAVKLIDQTHRGLHCKDTEPKFVNKYSQKRNCAALFPIPTFMFICERFICSYDRFAYLAAAKKWMRGHQFHFLEYINRILLQCRIWWMGGRMWRPSAVVRVSSIVDTSSRHFHK